MTIKEFKIQYALGTLSEDDKIKITDTAISKEVLTILSRDECWHIRVRVDINNYTFIKVLRKCLYRIIDKFKNNAYKRI